MKLLQKSPVGLAFAFVIAMSSCSKDDMQAPQPDVTIKQTEANMKAGRNLPILAPTSGPTGLDVYASQWQRYISSKEASATLAEFPSGASSMSHLWGNAALPWVKPLAIPSGGSASSILTVTSEKKDADSYLGNLAWVKSKIKNLQWGKEYVLTYHVATTIPNMPSQKPVVYAKKAVINLNYVNGSNNLTYLDFTGKQSEWVKGTITFTAYEPEIEIAFSVLTDKLGDFAYGHIYLDNNSIKQIN